MRDEYEAYVADILARSDVWESELLIGGVGHRLTGHEPATDFANSVLDDAVVQPISHILLAKGKKWRTVMALIILDMLGAGTEARQRALATLSEFIHSGSLVVDDVQDQSPVRRGVASLHVKYGNATAINVGNLMYFLPLKAIGQIDDISSGQKAEIYAVLAHYFCEAHLGQAFDIECGRPSRARELFDLPVAAAIQIVRSAYVRKTASWPMGLGTVASIMAEAPSLSREALERFSELLGVAFQIVDDTRDAIGVDNKKRKGEDIRNGKPSYLNIVAAGLLNPTQRRRFMDIVIGPSSDCDPEELDEALSLIMSTDAIKYCQVQVEQTYRNAWSLLCAEFPPSFERTALDILCRELLDLNVHEKRC